MTAALCLLVVSITVPLSPGQSVAGAEAPVQVRNGFHFQVHAPFNKAAPLFGPEGERSWAGEHWNPQFLFPRPAKDVQGSVFTVQHGQHNSLWVNTVFDLAAGKMQYVAFIPEVMVSVIDVRLTSMDASNTAVEVTYTRTAVDAAANGTVKAMGYADQQSGPQWQSAIEKSQASEKR